MLLAQRSLTLVLTRKRIHRFSSGQKIFLYWRFTPCSFLFLLCEKVTAQRQGEVSNRHSDWCPVT